MSKEKKLKVAIIGSGGIAQACHMPGWKQVKSAEVVATVDTNIENAKKLARDFNVRYVFDDYREVMKMDDVNVVDVCTPNVFHKEISIAMLKAGKHVIVEKPMCVDSDDADEILKAVKKYKKKFMVAQNQRFSNLSKTMKKVIQDGELGDVYYGRAWALRKRLLPPAPTFIMKKLSGGGPMFDIGVHILDLTYWMLGCPEPMSVSGITAVKLAKRNDVHSEWGEWDRKKYDVEDFASAFVKFKNGVSLALEVSFLLNMKESHNMSMTLFGTKAGCQWPSGEIYKTRFGNNTHYYSTEFAAMPEVATHHQEIKEFAECVLQDKPSPIPVEQSVNVIKILDAVYKSGRTGREVIFR